jgi:hypothetical protein
MTIEEIEARNEERRRCPPDYHLGDECHCEDADDIRSRSRRAPRRSTTWRQASSPHPGRLIGFSLR